MKGKEKKFTKKNKDFFARRLAGLWLVQSGILPEEALGLEPEKENNKGFQSVGEILMSDKYWDRLLKQWRKNADTN